MSSLGVFKPELPQPPVPGLGSLPRQGLLSPAGNQRKKPKSIAPNGIAWPADEPAYAAAPRPKSRLESLSALILPDARTFTRSMELTRNVMAHTCAVALTFACASTLIPFLNFAFTGNVAALLRPRIFPSALLGFLALQIALLTMLSFPEHIYHTGADHSPEKQRLVLARAVGWSTTMIAAAASISGVQRLHLATLVLAAPLNYLLLLAWRQRVPKTLPANQVRNVLIVGAGVLGRKLASEINRDPHGSYIVRGFLDDCEPAIGNVLGRVKDMSRIARREFIDEVILAAPHQKDMVQAAIFETHQSGLDVKIALDLFDCVPCNYDLHQVGGMHVVTLHQHRVPAVSLFLKRVIDVLCSTAALVSVAPILGVVTAAIKLDSPGPALYRAPRVGKKGRSFMCYKFRTMRADADRWKDSLRSSNERTGAAFKMEHDPRVTCVGRFLRRYSLDELPQFWNVLRGDMSLVGPRPHPLDDFSRYDLEDFRRLNVTPGITGLWQVTARGDPSFKRNVALDVEYIERWNFWMDLRILCRTIAVVMQGSGV